MAHQAGAYISRFRSMKQLGVDGSVNHWCPFLHLGGESGTEKCLAQEHNVQHKGFNLDHYLGSQHTNPGVYRYVPPQRVWFLSRFGLKTGIDFEHFSLKLGMVIGGTFMKAYKLIFLPTTRASNW